MSLIALPTQSLGRIGGETGKCDGLGLGPFACIDIKDPVATIRTFATGISNLVAFITIIAGLWFGFQIILGAMQWLSSGGDKTGLENARNRLLHAFAGMMIVVLALAIVGILGTFFGLDILLTKPEEVIKQIMPK